MSPEAITTWLDKPAALPGESDIESSIRSWPWFLPVRLMELVKEQQQSAFSDAALARIRLYSHDWLPAYSLLMRAENHDQAGAAKASGDFAAANDFVDEHFEEAVLSEDPEAETQAATADKEKEEQFIQPFYTEDYFRHQGTEAETEAQKMPEAELIAPAQSLMVVMSFAEWLTHFKVKSQKEQEEAQEKSALRSMWQQEKLAAALDDEPEEIPEDVFEMAVSSITREDDIVSESLAQIYERQEKWSAAGEMYRKLALKYPAKSAYFATRAEAAKKRLT